MADISKISVDEIEYELKDAVARSQLEAIQRQATSIRAVQDGQTITVTTTLQGDVVHTDIITLDENGYPVSLVADGVVCAMEFVGFDATEATEVSETAEGGDGE